MNRLLLQSAPLHNQRHEENPADRRCSARPGPHSLGILPCRNNPPTAQSRSALHPASQLPDQRLAEGVVG